MGLSDHQTLYCTIKTSRMKRCTHKQIRCRSLINYSADVYEEGLGRFDFPNYHNFRNINDPYSNFIQKVMEDIDLQSLTKYLRLTLAHYWKILTSLFQEPFPSINQSFNFSREAGN